MSVKLNRFDLLPHGDVLATRTRGRDVGRQAIDSLGNSQVLLLNFTGVQVASPPFLDEFLTALRTLVGGGDTGRLLAVVGVNQDVAESFAMVLSRRKLMMAEVQREQVSLLGAPEQLQETLDAAVAIGATFTAPELADRLAIKLPALHQRLKALADSGVVARKVDSTAVRGVRYEYSNVDVRVVDELDAPHQTA